MDNNEVKNEERKLSTWEKVILVLDAAVLAAGFGVLGYSIHRERKLNKLLQGAIGKVASMTEVNVSEGIVNAGMERAVNREVGRIAHKAAENCAADISMQVTKRVGDACHKSYGKIEAEVAAKIADEVAKIYKDDLMEDIRTMAKEQIAEQFESKLDDVLENYNSNLSNINKIYQSIADSMTPKKTDAKGIELKLA